jgi:hypothetical protein
MALDRDTQRLLDIYAFTKAALELCAVEVIKGQQGQGHAEVLAIIRAMGAEWGAFWNAFRAKWGIPDPARVRTSLASVRTAADRLGEISA